ncbi:DUF4260 domain-containing protein [Gynurincola endophyticus]|uniref:DUF4260 domain-containing protein n=1 Tax=Gynurincola endophyticus TaxID=2479004 RepID=UPI000F8F6DCB|nr:DUF4260 domain-containing protein [Gynurincola endophyticus]
MKQILSIEAVAEFFAAYFLFRLLNMPEWMFWAFLLAPDISMIGYSLGNKWGAYIYNFVHHKGVAIGVALAGWFLNSDIVIFTGILLYAHASIDRVFGYGLKYITGFSDTHLGKIGKRHK